MEEVISVEDTKYGLLLRFLTGPLMGHPSQPMDCVTIDIDNGTYTLVVERLGDDEVGITLRDAVSADPLFEGGWSNDWEGMLEGEEEE